MAENPLGFSRSETKAKTVVLHCSFAWLRRPKSFGSRNYDQPLRFSLSREINMIKFFRKIRYDLMEKNPTSANASAGAKTGKYLKYAIGEIVLVVIGILIALQINNWNEKRKDGINEQIILKSLKVNLKENLKLLNLANKATIDAYNSSLNLHELIKPKSTIVNTNQINSLISVMFDYFTFDPNSGAINEIINSGQLNIIKNEELKNQISNWSGMVEDTQRDGDIANKHAFDNMVMYLSRHGSISNLPLGNNMIQNMNLKQKSTSSFEVDYQNLMNSSEFENLVGWHSTNMIYLLNEYKSFKSYIENIIDIIDSETKEN